MKIKTYDAEKISKPENTIVAVDEDFIYNDTKTFFLKQFLDKDSKSKYAFTVNNIHNKNYFNIKKDGQTKIIYDIYKKPILNIRHSMIFPHIAFYKGNEDKEMIASVQPDTTIVEFYNQFTKKQEILNILNDKFNCSCGIFYGKEKEGAPMICKIREIMDANTFITYCDKEYTIEISEGVDIVIIIALAISFAEMNFITRRDRIKDSDPYNIDPNSQFY
ncbi:hypothetical protein BCR36DRAFT_582741 [Piromyces finnis]|uniref:DUF567-domain-containing protein n=1 Tax=Piromyces finnis TaxID=1754191 RepID=A0A1Y1VC63_9FUNG|nr:hypothetical protein BCR36DRAFT_582741 [Piromyces finnis]|eukprot:ORX52241.1 hypothetical protein BCR36DRAFT_582741 [Piromyces finnis]